MTKTCNARSCRTSRIWGAGLVEIVSKFDHTWLISDSASWRHCLSFESACCTTTSMFFLVADTPWQTASWLRHLNSCNIQYCCAGWLYWLFFTNAIAYT